MSTTSPAMLSGTVLTITTFQAHITRTCFKSSYWLPSNLAILHMPVTDLLVLPTLSWVASSWCTILNKKLDGAGLRPGNLILLQVTSQSLPGLVSSTLQGIILLSCSPMYSMVSLSFIIIWYRTTGLSYGCNIKWILNAYLVEGVEDHSSAVSQLWVACSLQESPGQSDQSFHLLRWTQRLPEVNGLFITYTSGLIIMSECIQDLPDLVIFLMSVTHRGLESFLNHTLAYGCWSNLDRKWLCPTCSRWWNFFPSESCSFFEWE